MNVFLDIVSLCALIVGVICVFLVLHPQYNDGLFGRLGLVIIGISAFARAANLFTGDSPPVSNIGAMLWIGLAIFLSRHLSIFMLHKDKADARPMKK